MRKVFILLLLFMVGCQSTPVATEAVVPVSRDLAIKYAAVFLFIMENDETWGKEELEAEEALLRYYLSIESNGNF